MQNPYDWVHSILCNYCHCQGFSKSGDISNANHARQASYATSILHISKATRDRYSICQCKTLPKMWMFSYYMDMLEQSLAFFYNQVEFRYGKPSSRVKRLTLRIVTPKLESTLLCVIWCSRWNTMCPKTSQFPCNRCTTGTNRHRQAERRIDNSCIRLE